MPTTFKRGARSVRNQMIAVGLVAVFAGAWAGPALAWGHLPEFGVASQSPTLVLDVVERGRIRFCVENKDDRYVDGDLEILVEASLRVWLTEIEDLVGRDIAVERECAISMVDLMVVFGDVAGGSNGEGPADFAYRAPLTRGANRFSLVAFNTVDTNAAGGNELVFMSALDFLGETASLDQADKLEFLRLISTDAPNRFLGRRFATMERVFGRVGEKAGFEVDTGPAVAERLGITDNPADLFPVMIHEFGHAFGLCDMRPIPYEIRCNRQWRTELTDSSVMAFGGYVLRPDDIEGIRSIFERFAKRPFLDGRIFGADDRQPDDRFNRALVRIEREDRGPLIGTFVGDCRTVLASGHGLFSDGGATVSMEDMALFPVWQTENAVELEVDWETSVATSVADGLEQPIFRSAAVPEADFFAVRLTEDAEGCQPVIIDQASATQIVNANGPFEVVSLGGFGPDGRLAATVSVQAAGSCEIFSRPFGNKFYQDPANFLTDCDLSHENEGSPVITEQNGEFYLIGISAGADRLPQFMRSDESYIVPVVPGQAEFASGATYRGSEGSIAGANIFIRLGGALLAAITSGE